ncbi:MAG TPA: hypothetical protein VGP72_12140 [Planctomycetota bacterium]|jgi:hypothetical protein
MADEGNLTPDEIRLYLEGHSELVLELRAKAILESHQFNCIYGGLYSDPQSNKTRQFDIRAFFAPNNTKGIYVAAECKAIKCPIVISCLKRSKAEAHHSIIHYGEEKTCHSFYLQNEPVGKCLDQLVRKREEAKGRRPEEKSIVTINDHEVFDKWSQALQSCHELAILALDKCKTNVGYAASIIPILVVPPGMLWVAEFNASGILSADPYQMDRCTYYVGKTFSDIRYEISHLEIVTPEGLRQLAVLLHAKMGDLFA